jgi:hypothetical protein
MTEGVAAESQRWPVCKLCSLLTGWRVWVVQIIVRNAMSTHPTMHSISVDGPVSDLESELASINVDQPSLLQLPDNGHHFVLPDVLAHVPSFDCELVLPDPDSISLDARDI